MSYRLKASLNRLITSTVDAVCATSCMIACFSLKAIQAIPKGSDLTAMLALVPIVHVDKHIIQGIIHAIPGQSSYLEEHFRTNPLSQRHHLRVRIIELAQNLS